MRIPTNLGQQKPIRLLALTYAKRECTPRNGNFELARGALEKSLEVLQTLVTDVGTGDYMEVLAKSQYQFAKYYLATEEKTQAMDWFQKSIDSQNRALAKSPASIEYRDDLATYRDALEAVKQ